MNTKKDDIHQNLKDVMDDAEKWGRTDWIMRIQWVSQIILFHSKVIENKETYEVVDLFWIKLWGLIDEFPDEIEKYYKHIEDALNPNSDFYNKFSSQESKEKLYKYSKEALGQSGADLIEKCKDCIGYIKEIQSKFTDDELLLIYDYRVHVAHPIATYFRLSLRKNGTILDKFRKKERKEIQEIVKKEFEKFHIPYSTETSQSRAIKEFCSRISKQDLELIKEALINIQRIINPLMLF